MIFHLFAGLLLWNCFGVESAVWDMLGLQFKFSNEELFTNMPLKDA